jgi:hypothetical protein
MRGRDRANGISHVRCSQNKLRAARPKSVKTNHTCAGPAITSSFLILPPIFALAWGRFAIWLIVGLVLYFCCGYRGSRLRDEMKEEV